MSITHKQSFLYFFLFLILLFTVSLANAQAYRLTSFENKNVEIILKYRLFSKTLTISYEKDTVYLSEFTGIIQTRIVNNKFLQIIYGVRGGSGLDLKKVIILCVYRNKIHIPLLVTSYSKYAGIDSLAFYKLKMKFKVSNKKNFQIIANITEGQKYAVRPQQNNNSHLRTIMQFDTIQKIFFNDRKTVSKDFTLFDIETQQTTKISLKGELPIIRLGKNIYYYFKQQWYEKGKNNNLLKYYCKLN